LLAWAIAMPLIAVSTVLGYQRWRRRTPNESLLFLQETLWTETRRDQRRLNRWLAWGKLRRQR
jgi:hypothetical protein